VLVAAHPEGQDGAMEPAPASPRRRFALLGALLLAAGGLVWFLASRREAPGPASSGEAGPVADAGPAPGLAAGRARDGAPDATAGEKSAKAALGTPFEGGVVDEDQVAVAGARVTLRPEVGEPVEVRTGAGGRWAASVVRLAPGKLDVAVSARTDDGRAASAAFAWMPSALRADAGVLVLGHASTLVVRATSSDRPVAGADVYASVVAPWAPPSYAGTPTRPWVGWPYHARTDASGEARLEGVPDGDVRVVVLAAGPLRGEARVQAPRKDAAPLVVALAAARDIDVEVVEKATGAPVAGARLLVWGEDFFLVAEPVPVEPTAANGHTWIRSAPIGVSWSLNAVWRGAVDPWGASKATTIPPDAMRYRLELSGGVRMRFPIAGGDGPVPAEGTLVLVRDLSGDDFVEAGFVREKASVADGHVIVERMGPMEWLRAVGTLADGRIGLLASTRDGGEQVPTPQPVRFVRPRTLTVRVHDAQGNPAPGCAVRLFLVNGNDWGPARAVDDEGIVVFEGLVPTVFSVRALSSPELVEEGRRCVFSDGEAVDLSAGDAEVDRVVEPVRDAVVSVWVDGAPGIPSQALISVGLQPETLEWTRPSGLEVDRARGEIRFRVRPPPARARRPQECHLEVRLSARGLPAASTSLVLEEATGRLVGRLSLGTGGALVMSVRAPADGGASVYPERLEADGRWVPTGAKPAPVLDGRPDVLYEGIPLGRYRLRDTVSGCVSEVAEVVKGTNPVFLSLDLSRSGFAEGTVDLPEGAAVGDARVVATAKGIDLEGLDRYGPNFTVLPPNVFRVRVPGDRPVRLVPAAPGCIPDPAMPELVVEAPGAGLRLRLVRK